MAVGKKIKQYRESKGMSQKKVAEYVGVSQADHNQEYTAKFEYIGGKGNERTTKTIRSSRTGSYKIRTQIRKRARKREL